MRDHPSTPTTPPGPPVPLPSGPETTLLETAKAAAADLADLVTLLPGDATTNARIAERLAEELAELGQMLRSLPGRPAPMLGHGYALLGALRTAHAAHEDVAGTIARALARLAGELGGARQVLRNRPESWEAASVRELLRGTLGPDDENLSAYGPGPGSGCSL